MSESEGGVPVAIQEAQAQGIPTIGTNAGGIPEIVNDDVGVLLKANPEPEEIADAINYIISDQERFMQMRKNSVLNWNDKFNADKNYELFINGLIELMK